MLSVNSRFFSSDLSSQTSRRVYGKVQGTRDRFEYSRLSSRRDSIVYRRKTWKTEISFFIPTRFFLRPTPPGRLNAGYRWSEAKHDDDDEFSALGACPVREDFRRTRRQTAFERDDDGARARFVRRNLRRHPVDSPNLSWASGGVRRCHVTRTRSHFRVGRRGSRVFWTRGATQWRYISSRDDSIMSDDFKGVQLFLSIVNRTRLTPPWRTVSVIHTRTLSWQLPPCTRILEYQCVTNRIIIITITIIYMYGIII